MYALDGGEYWGGLLKNIVFLETGPELNALNEGSFCGIDHLSFSSAYRYLWACLLHSWVVSSSLKRISYLKTYGKWMVVLIGGHENVIYREEIYLDLLETLESHVRFANSGRQMKFWRFFKYVSRVAIRNVGWHVVPFSYLTIKVNGRKLHSKCSFKLESNCSNIWLFLGT